MSLSYLYRVLYMQSRLSPTLPKGHLVAPQEQLQILQSKLKQLNFLALLIVFLDRALQLTAISTQATLTYKLP